LKRSSKTEILIIDELGFLEFEKNSGWKKAFTIIEKGNYHLGFVVVRPSYIFNSRKIWNVVDVIEIKNKEFIEEQVDQAIKDYRIHIK
jgi:nucleoside-triphosphatase THEP1